MIQIIIMKKPKEKPKSKWTKEQEIAEEKKVQKSLDCFTEDDSNG